MAAGAGALKEKINLLAASVRTAGTYSFCFRHVHLNHLDHLFICYEGFFGLSSNIKYMTTTLSCLTA